MKLRISCGKRPAFFRSWWRGAGDPGADYGGAVPALGAGSPAAGPTRSFMFFRVFHSTHYLYRAAVTASYNELRLRPATADERRVEFFLLNVQPPGRLQHFRDEHLNYVHWFERPEPHWELLVEATSQVHTTSQYAEGRPVGVSFGDLAGGQGDEMHPFLGDSRYVAVEPDVWRLGLDIRDDRRDVFETAEAVMGYLYREWKYDPAATSVSTHMRESFARRAGVCQDFAHVMIGLCRSLGIAARYVSGYVFAGQGVRGAQASHAWCEIHLPGRGWFGLDPTNNLLVDEHYVKIATGRDYEDAAPVRGRLSGPPDATASLAVKVEMELLD